MKQWVRQGSILSIFVAVAIVGTLSFSGRAQTFSRTSWEYKVISTYGPSETSPPPNVPQLDKAGAEGWELIDIRVGSLDAHPTAPTQVRTDYYFKRAK